MERDASLAQPIARWPRWKRTLSSAVLAIGDLAATHGWILRLTYPLTIGLMVVGYVVAFLGAGLSLAQVSALGASMLMLTALQQEAMKRGSSVAALHAAHVATALLLITAAVSYTGGVQSPLVWIYALPVVIESVLLGLRWGVIAAALSTGYLLAGTAAVRSGWFPLGAPEWPPAVTTIFLFSYTAMFFIIAATMTAIYGWLETQRSEIMRRSQSEQENYIGIIRALSASVATKDMYTGDYAGRLEKASVRLAEALGVRPEQIEQIRVASILHDIGKIGVPDAILLKPTTLTDGEWSVIQRHVHLGASILGEIPALQEAAKIVRHTHERFDGLGYPDGLAADAIPIGSRIIAVVDAYQAMTTDRPYRKALALDAAAAELRTNSGTQFDPQVVDVFLRIYGSALEGSPKTPSPPGPRLRVS